MDYKTRIILNNLLLELKGKYVGLADRAKRINNVEILKDLLDKKNVGRGLCISVKAHLVDNHTNAWASIFGYFKRVLIETCDEDTLFYGMGYYKMREPCYYSNHDDIIDALRIRIELIDLLLEKI